MRTLHTVLLLLASALALGLRARGLEGFAITHWDEGLVWRGAHYFLTLGAEGHYSPSHGPPLVSAVMAALAWLLGPRPELAVWWNVVLGTAAVPLAYWVGRELATPRTGLVAAFLFAGSGLHAMFARSLLTESTYTFFLLASLGLSLRTLERPRAGWFLATGLAVACTQATKYNGCLAAVPLATVVGLRFVRTPEAGRLGVLLGRLALLVLPAAAVVLANLIAIASFADLGAFLEHYRGYVGASADFEQVLGTLAWVTPWAVLGLAPLGLLARLRGGGRTLLLHVALLLYVGFLLRYAFYLRLLLPVVTLLLLYAALGIDFLASRLPRAAGAALVALFLALVGAQAWQRGGRFYLERFDGYRVASRWLEGRPQDVARLFATQDFVWWGLAAEGDGDRAPVFALPSRAASEILATSGEVELVVDVGAFSRLRPWNLTRVFPVLRERYLVQRFPATLNLDVLQNNLTLDELRRLERDAALRERVLSIHVFRLPGAELLRLVDAGGSEDG